MIRLFSYEKYANRRDELGLTDYQVAKQSGVKTCTLSEWKNHYKSNGLRGYCPKLEKMTAIAKVLKMEVSQLINSESQDDRKEIVLNELQIFNSNEFGQIRTVQLNNETYFVGKDIADNLGYQNGSRDINRHVDEEDRTKCMVFDGNQNKETIIINESGLYSLILSSKLESAKRFKHWVTSEVLPSTRKNGGYIAGQETLSDEELMAKALLVAQNKIAERDAIIERQQAKIEADRPKTIFADAVSTSHTSILVGDLAKLICQNGVQIGQKRLFQWLRDNGYLMKYGASYNMPIQKYLEHGLFEIKESNVQNPDGSVRITRTPKVTGKGQIYFINKFLQGK